MLNRMVRTMMTLSMFKSRNANRDYCPHCGHLVGAAPISSWIEIGLGILAITALVLMLVPMGILAWKSWTNFVSDRGSHSIFYHPLEDWSGQ